MKNTKRRWWQPPHCTDADLVCVWCGDHLPEGWKSQRCRVGIRERLRWLREELELL